LVCSLFLHKPIVCLHIEQLFHLIPPKSLFSHYFCFSLAFSSSSYQPTCIFTSAQSLFSHQPKVYLHISPHVSSHKPKFCFHISSQFSTHQLTFLFTSAHSLISHLLTVHLLIVLQFNLTLVNCLFLHQPSVFFTISHSLFSHYLTLCQHIDQHFLLVTLSIQITLNDECYIWSLPQLSP
jgi:hypothetical protein